MKEITIAEAGQELSKQLERTLSRLALAADSHVSTYYLEDDAKKLAGKLKVFAEQIGNMKIYADCSGRKVYNPEKDLPDNLFAPYCKLCKDCNQAIEVTKEDDRYFAEVTKGIYVCIDELPSQEMPVFKVAVKDGQLIAVRADLLDKLSSDVKKLIGKGENND